MPGGVRVHDRLAGDFPPREYDATMGWDLTDESLQEGAWPEAFRGTFARLADARFYLHAREDVLALGADLAQAIADKTALRTALREVRARVGEGCQAIADIIDQALHENRQGGASTVTMGAGGESVVEALRKDERAVAIAPGHEPGAVEPDEDLYLLVAVMGGETLVGTLPVDQYNRDLEQHGCSGQPILRFGAQQADPATRPERVLAEGCGLATMEAFVDALDPNALAAFEDDNPTLPPPIRYQAPEPPVEIPQAVFGKVLAALR